MKFKILYSFLALLYLLPACNTATTPSSRYMVLDEVTFVDAFPHSYSLSNDIPVRTEAIGAQTFAILDSLLFIQTSDPEGFWQIYSLPEERLVGKFFRKGNGPMEFVRAPAMNFTEFYRNNGRIAAMIFDPAKDRLVEIDVSGLLDGETVEPKIIAEHLASYAINALWLDQNTLFCRDLSDRGNQLPRYLLKEGKTVIPENLAELNLSEVNIGEDHNILAAEIKYNRDRDLILETPTMLGHINLYSPEGTFGKTICVGGKVDNIEKIQDINPAERIYTYDGARMFPGFFAALYCNEDVGSYETQRKNLPSIQLFDWEGNPLVELKLNRFCTSFAIDTINGYIYIFDNANEEMYKYDIKGITDFPV